MPFPESFFDAVRAVDTRIEVVNRLDGVEPELLAEADVLYTGDLYPSPQQAPRLTWVQLDTSGIDHVRGTAFWDGPCTMTTLGGISPAPLAEWILMMVLAHAHRLPLAMRLQQRREWPTRQERWEWFMPRNLRTSTLGIVGYGRIGRELARMAAALGMSVVATRRGHGAAADQFGGATEVPGVTMLQATEVATLMSQCDYVAVTVPLTDETRGMIGPEQLAAAKPGLVLVNGSRGGVVDEAALLEQLDAGRIDMVASDVFDEEPLPADSRFWAHERSIVTPHVAGFAPDYTEAVTRLFTENLRRHLAGEPLLNVADRGRGY